MADDYDWYNVSTLYLDIHNADAFELLDILCSGNIILSLSQLVTLTLLKLRMYFDLAAFDAKFQYERIDLDVELLRPVGKLVRERLRSLSSFDLAGKVMDLEV